MLLRATVTARMLRGRVRESTLADVPRGKEGRAMMGKTYDIPHDVIEGLIDVDRFLVQSWGRAKPGSESSERLNALLTKLRLGIRELRG